MSLREELGRLYEERGLSPLAAEFAAHGRYGRVAESPVALVGGPAQPADNTLLVEAYRARGLTPNIEPAV